jgi:hypothetical protein
MPISGFQRHAFMWASCHDTDQRLMFSKNTEVPETETALAPVRSPTSIVRNLRAVAKGLLGPALGKTPRIRKGCNPLSDGPRSRFVGKDRALV